MVFINIFIALQAHTLMPANASPEFVHAEKKFYLAKTDEEKLSALEEMIRTMPMHKSAEAMRANLRTRYKKLQEKIDSKKKSSKGRGRPGIKKGELQAVLVGLTNSGKSSILASLTNAKPEISQYSFTTKYPILGTLDYENIKIQIVDLPAPDSEYFDSGIANNSDVLLIVITHIEDIDKISQFIKRADGKKIYIFNKIDLLSENEKRRTEARLRTNKLNFILFSSITLENLHELEEKIFLAFNKLRIYTKQPKKPADKDPVIMPQNSTVKDVAEKIFHGLSNKVKEARITGPSGKFPNQKIGLDHKLKDRDVVEFRT